ncbi:MAG: tripartite tricarboxylate transporter substrate binding protein [Patescibacteria group bacterium]
MLKYLVMTAILLVPAVARAEYPARAITLVVPFGPGAVQDATARVLARGLSKHLGQSVVVENRRSAYGVPTVRTFKDANPDGYTLLHGHDGQFGFMGSVFDDHNERLGRQKHDLGYDPARDFTPLGTFAEYRWLLTANKSLGVSDVASLRAYAESHPKLAMGSVGPSPTLIAALLKKEMGLSELVVPKFGTDGEAMLDMLAGRTHLFAASTATVLEQGDAIAYLGAVGAHRNDLFPSLQTLAEQGLTALGTVPDTWTGLFCPLRCPADVVAALKEALAKTAADPEIVGQLKKMGVGVHYRPAEAVPALIKETYRVHKELLRQTGVWIIE